MDIKPEESVATIDIWKKHPQQTVGDIWIHGMKRSNSAVVFLVATLKKLAVTFDEPGYVDGAECWVVDFVES